MPELLVVKQVATYLRCQPRKVQRMIRHGELQGFRLSQNAREWRVHHQDLVEFVARRRDLMKDNPESLSFLGLL